MPVEMPNLPDTELLDGDDILFECLDSIDFAVFDSLELIDENLSHATKHSETISIESIIEKCSDTESVENNSFCNDQKRQKSEDHSSILSHDEVFDEISYLIPIHYQPAPFEYENVPRLFVDTFNLGDMDRLKQIMFSCLDSNCEFRMKKPTHSISDTGAFSVVNFYKQFHNNCPDAIILLRGCKRREMKSGYILRCKFNTSGTIVNSAAFQEKYLKVDGKTMSMADMMDPSKYSKSDIDAIRVSELMIRSQKKLIRSFMKGTMFLYVNEEKAKIEMFDVTMTLSSIKAFDG